jgi:hypothetical protein
MKRLLLICHTVVVLACAAWADANVHILEVGLNGRCVYYRPCSALVAVSNPYPTSQDFELQVSLRFARRTEQFDAQQTYTHHLTLAPREVREIDVPIDPFRGASIVDVTVRLSQGNIVGHDALDATELVWKDRTHLVGVLCQQESVCKGIQEQIQLSGSSQDRDWKNRNLELAMQLRPRSQWWSYAPASIIVVAIPASRLSGDERSALEWFARGGGSLVILEEEFADKTFLSDYRQDAAGRKGEAIGSGGLYRIPRLSSNALEGLFSGGESELVARCSRAGWPGYELRNLQSQYATTFGFPSWWALLIWLAAYILLVGVLNFAILRRLSRREWGWLTVAGIALLFVFALYWLASRRGPRQVTVDYTAVHHLDSHSSRAFTEYGLRVSVPQRQQITLEAPANTLLDTRSQLDDRWLYADGYRSGFPTVQLGRRFVHGFDGVRYTGWDPLPGSEIALHMQRRTSRDLQFAGTTSFLGTLRETFPGHLHNDTGQRFFDAIFLDSEQRRIWFLGEVAPDAEIDLSKVRYEPPGLCDTVAFTRNTRGFDSKSDDFFLSEFACVWLDPRFQNIASTRRFYGLSTGPAESAQPLGVRCQQQQYALTEVVFR